MCVCMCVSMYVSMILQAVEVCFCVVQNACNLNTPSEIYLLLSRFYFVGHVF